MHMSDRIFKIWNENQQVHDIRTETGENVEKDKTQIVIKVNKTER